jgi:hypothetical protein
MKLTSHVGDMNFQNHLKQILKQNVVLFFPQVTTYNNKMMCLDTNIKLFELLK